MTDERMKSPKTWWMCLNPYPEARPPTMRHESFHEAQREALRLAQITGRKIHVLKLEGTAHPPQQVARWEVRG
jgi:hypothetical protein